MIQHLCLQGLTSAQRHNEETRYNQLSNCGHQQYIKIIIFWVFIWPLLKLLCKNHIFIPTNNFLLQPTGDSGDNGGDVTGEGWGGRNQESSAGLRQGRQGEADEWVSPPPHHLCRSTVLLNVGWIVWLAGYAKLTRPSYCEPTQTPHCAQGRPPQKYVRLWNSSCPSSCTQMI